ncbi:MAG TPA: apolipoprotein N-acyltransferase [Caulobacteraceae bacterium]|nr:apolipoprotein N-acyltransferase [Caulobacteraceae bacterium]
MTRPDAPARPPAARLWLGRALAIAAGLACAFAHPPWGVLPGLLGYALLMGLLDRSNPARPVRSAFLVGWLAGCAYFSVGLWWVSEAFMVDAAEQGWMAPFAVILLAAGMALFWGAAGALYRAFAARGPWRVLWFAGAFAIFEWTRGHVLTGLPWDLVGETWRAGSAMSQGAALIGAYGLTFVTLAIAAAPAVILEGRGGKATIAAAAALLAGLFAFGQTRLAQAVPTPAGAPWVRIVQAMVRQETKYDERAFAGIVDRYVQLTGRPAAHRPDLVIWPEGAVPAALDDYLANGTWTEADFARVIQPGQILVVGGFRFADQAETKAYNSLAVMRRTPDGFRAIGLYDKYRLVPFGEYMPLDSLASKVGFKQLVHVGDGFLPGPRPRPLSPPGAPPFQPLICYESLFPGFTREGQAMSGVRPLWIANLSNDAWFGTTSGPWQHLNIASYRAIEEGLPMVRATPTGVSAMVDAYGRPLQILGQGVFGVIDAQLPAALSPTLFNRIGDLPLLILVIVSLAGSRLLFARPWAADN